MHPSVEALGRFRVDIGALANDAAECRLDMGAGTTETVVKVEVAEGGVHVIPPHQSDHPAAEPDAFGIAGRPVYQTASFGKFVDLALRVFGGIGGLGGGGLIAALGVAALGESRQGRKHRACRYQKGEAETHSKGHGRTGWFWFVLFRDCVALFVHRMGPICGPCRANLWQVRLPNL